MTADEARRVLGLAEGDDGRARRPLDPEEVRKTYLRLIKIHRPDRDREMFMRVREAFEILRDVAAFEQTSATGQATSLDEDTLGPLNASPASPNAPSSAEPSSFSEPEGAARAPDPELPTLEELRQSFEAISATNLKSREEMAREAIAQFPDAAEPWFWLLSVQEARHVPGQLSATLREAAVRHPLFLLTLFEKFPLNVNQNDLERALRSGHRLLMAEAARMLVPRGQAARAAEVGLELVSALPADSFLPLFPLMYLALELLALGERESALGAALVQKLDQALREHETMLDAPTMATWSLVREIGRLPVGFPPAWRQAAACRALNPDVHIGLDLAASQVMTIPRGARRRWLTVLGDKAPYTAALAEYANRIERTRRKFSFSKIPLGAIFPLAYLLFKLLDSCASEPNPQPKRPYLPPSTYRYEPLGPR